MAHFRPATSGVNVTGVLHSGQTKMSRSSCLIDMAFPSSEIVILMRWLTVSIYLIASPHKSHKGYIGDTNSPGVADQLEKIKRCQPLGLLGVSMSVTCLRRIREDRNKLILGNHTLRVNEGSVDSDNGAHDFSIFLGASLKHRQDEIWQLFVY